MNRIITLHMIIDLLVTGLNLQEQKNPLVFVFVFVFVLVDEKAINLLCNLHGNLALNDVKVGVLF